MDCFEGMCSGVRNRGREKIREGTVTMSEEDLCILFGTFVTSTSFKLHVWYVAYNV
jgi:hypothetical protein